MIMKNKIVSMRGKAHSLWGRAKYVVIVLTAVFIGTLVPVGLNRAKAALSNRRGEGFVDTAVFS